MNHLENMKEVSAVGKVSRLARYPVKSMGGEELEVCQVEEAGLRGDRVRVLVKARSEKRLTARQLPELLHYSAAWSESADGSDEGMVHIRTPNGGSKSWMDQNLFSELERKAKEPLAWMVYGAEDPLTGVDDSPLLIITEQSLREIGRMWKPEANLWRRFRPNVVIRLEEGESLVESDWIGRKFVMGDAVVEVVKGCERCSMITIDPVTLRKDPSLLAMVNGRWKGSFGLYARVVRKGLVRMDDEFKLLPDGQGN